MCILHGKRADNGDTWTESFSIQEAKSAGLYRQGGPWSKFPKDMLFARALSRLARQLFPDVIKGVYVEGEIPREESSWSVEVEKEEVPTMGEEKAKEIESILTGCEEYKENLLGFIKQTYNVDKISQVPEFLYDRIKSRAIKERGEILDPKEEAVVEDEADLFEDYA